MAKLERELVGDFDQLLQRLEKGILQSSLSASLEEESDFYGEGSRCSVRVFERYSLSGSNRLSLTLVLFQSGDVIRLSACSTGGSEGVFFKFNTWGESAFLSTLEELL